MGAHTRFAVLALAALFGSPAGSAGAETARASPMLRGWPGSGVAVSPLLTVGEPIDGGYRLPGVLDGTAAFALGPDRVLLLVNHELGARRGYAYELANGTELRGARVSALELDVRSRRIVGGRLAYDSVRDRRGRLVSRAAQINEGRGGDAGLDALCSAAGYRAGSLGFVDDLMLTHEEASSREGHPHGGSVWALDVRDRELWALPALGRGTWENSVALPTPDAGQPDGHVALLLGDDYERGGAPLYLWLGRKQPGGTFPERNGLASGSLFSWVADDGSGSPADWSGTGSIRTGRFVALRAREPARAGGRGYDAQGYLDDTRLRDAARKAGAFMFSRPEDLHANPANPRQVAMSSTGQGWAFPADDWGTLYLIDVVFERDESGELEPQARIEILYDADEAADRGIRSPDNLVWASDGALYVQEDPATRRARFGAASGIEASIWRVVPGTRAAPERLAVIDRAAVPPGASDSAAGRPGAWESSGILDVSRLIGAGPRELVLVATVQAHTVTDGPIGGRNDLVQASQLLLLSIARP